MPLRDRLIIVTELKTPAGRVKLRIDGELRGADLSGKDLAGVLLEDEDLRGTNFSGAVLTGALLSGADLRQAPLKNAILEGAHFEESNPVGADLSGKRPPTDAGRAIRCRLLRRATPERPHQ